MEILKCMTSKHILEMEKCCKQKQPKNFTPNSKLIETKINLKNLHFGVGPLFPFFILTLKPSLDGYY